MDGWLKLHRKVTESAIFTDTELFRLWVLCLTKATHKGTSVLMDRQQVELAPGEFITGRKSLTDDYNQNLKKRFHKKELSVWRDLKFLEECGNLNIKSTNKYSVVTVVKWSEYQENEQQLNNNRTTDEQQLNTNKNEKNLRTKEPKEKELKDSSRKRPVYEPDSIPYRSASYLLKKIKEHTPDIKEPDIQKWANDMRLLIETDKRSPVTIASVIEWATADSFWRSNILSAGKLREKFDTLQSQMKRGGNHGTETSVRQGSDARGSEPNESSQPTYLPSKWVKADEHGNVQMLKVP